jgi:hypothetical protein
VRVCVYCCTAQQQACSTYTLHTLQTCAMPTVLLCIIAVALAGNGTRWSFSCTVVASLRLGIHVFYATPQVTFPSPRLALLTASAGSLAGAQEASWCVGCTKTIASVHLHRSSRQQSNSQPCPCCCHCCCCMLAQCLHLGMLAFGSGQTAFIKNALHSATLVGAIGAPLASAICLQMSWKTQRRAADMFYHCCCYCYCSGCSPNRLITPGRSPLGTWEDELRVPCNVSKGQRHAAQPLQSSALLCSPTQASAAQSSAVQRNVLCNGMQGSPGRPVHQQLW